MANTVGSRDYGPSWGDVGEMLARCQGKWGGAWFLQLTARYSRSQRGGLSVVCKRLRGSGSSGATIEDYVSRVYPHSDYSTLAECMFQLLYELDGKLDEAEQRAERQMTF